MGKVLEVYAEDGQGIPGEKQEGDIRAGQGGKNIKQQASRQRGDRVQFFKTGRLSSGLGFLLAFFPFVAGACQFHPFA